MKRILKVLLPFAVIAAAFIVYNAGLASESEYHDTTGHFAEKEIEKWSQYGVISGSNGAFRPDDGVTRAEMCTIISRIVTLPEAAENEFSDIEDGKWFADTMLKCVAAGIISGENGLLRPDEKLSRSDGFGMLLRALGADNVQSSELWYDTLEDKFGDLEQYEMYSGRRDIISGSYDMSGELTRAELVLMLEVCQSKGYMDMGNR